MSQYEALGTSATKAGLHTALKDAGLTESAKYFAQMFPDSSGDSKYRSFLHCDGAGTKTIVAYLMYREKGDAKWFRGLAQDALVMNLDDCLCVGPAEGMMLANAIARNSRQVPDEVLKELFTGYKECTELLANLGIPIQLAGGETADTADLVRTIVVDAVLSGRIRAEKMIDNSQIKPGDVIVGISSAGKASYETSENSGIASNGLTLARHALLSNEYQEKYPETTQHEGGKRTTSIGRYRLDNAPAGLGMTIGEALLSPTRTFAPLMMKIYGALPGKVHGMIHNTGGGLSKVIRFGQGNRYVKDSLLPVPPIFKLIQESAVVPDEEMYKVFNMGQRLEVYLDKSNADEVIALSAEFSLKAQIIGRVEASTSASQNEVIVTAPSGEITYSHPIR